jgi:hypothetical protein
MFMEIQKIMSKYFISREIDIAGPDGNAFALMGIGQSWLKQLDHADQQKEFVTECMSGDYEHLLEVFKSWFGENTIYNSNEFEEEGD